ncbi:hypothetical protein [Cellulomonas sp. RIT-PI-Y]|uniref:hypothetical protein n=1 Tax=Cellulomonas sp. RIT-PI-Y TaxID=3035297 RepID=UPI0021D8B6A5|nr:hypothetical protein [Cellulomonas sp. RIT-PI-Y]
MNDTQTLRDLLDVAIARHQTSRRQLAIKAQDAGFRIVDTTLNGIAAGTYKSQPKADTVRAIAWLAGVTDEAAFTAAGLPVPGPPFADELPPGVDNLSPKARKAVIEILRVLVEEERDGDAEHATPTKPARGAQVEHRGHAALAAMAGTPAYAEPDTTGEETQDLGGDDPA